MPYREIILNRKQKWIGIVLVGFVFLAILVVASVYTVSEIRFNKTYDVQPAEIDLPTDQFSIQEGKRLYITRACVTCHGENLEGMVIVDDPAAGIIASKNLTSGTGGIGGELSNAEFVKAIRHGIDPDNKALKIMPSTDYVSLSDKDLGAIIAYINSVEPVDNVPPQTNLGFVMRVLYLAGQVPLLAAELIDHQAKPAEVEAKIGIEYGQYLAVSCTGCHGEGYSGGPNPKAPPSFKSPTNLTPDLETGLGKWTEADFFNAMREGRRPDGQQLDPFMPWQSFSQMNDAEIKAIWLYLRSLPATKYGQH
jgi:mono/diheme cytochrome c family protein